MPYARHALLGGVLPDLPMFGFYLYQKLRGTPEATIWSETYFQPDWQLVFDVFNSAPLAALGCVLALAFAPPVRTALQVFFGAVLLHVALDLPLHHDDAHRHALPLSNYRFESPVSYWDPAHLGVLGAGLETTCVLICALLLARRYPGRGARLGLALLAASSLAAYLGLYWIFGVPALG